MTAAPSRSAQFHPDVQRVSEAIERAVQGMSSDQLSWSPEPGRWSTAEILEHLSITYGGTAKGMRKVAERGASLATKPTTYQRLARFVVTELGYLPGGRQAPKGTVPTGLAPEAVLAAIRGNLAEMDAAMSAAGQVVPSKAVADHPVLGPLTLRQWRRFHVAHTKHHMKQVAALREQVGA